MTAAPHYCAISSEAQSQAAEIAAEIEANSQNQGSLLQPQMPDSHIRPKSSASGLLLRNGYILTCYHAVANAASISIVKDAREFACRVRHWDAVNDVALLQVASNRQLEGVSASPALRVAQGDRVFTLGFPLPALQGQAVKFVSGEVSALSGAQDDPRMIQTTMPIHGGNSGGPVFNSKGRLVGIVVSKLDSLGVLGMTGEIPENTSYVLKSDYVVPLLKSAGLSLSKAKSRSDVSELIESISPSVVQVLAY